LEAIYRFALLITGDPQTAAGAILQILKESGGHASQFRNDAHRNACLAMKIRDLCLKKERAAAPREGEAAGGVSRNGAQTAFHLMPEPERSALALFYVDLFPASELAQVFRMKPERLSDTLSAGREFLRAQLEMIAPPESPLKDSQHPA
jgi:DNA-directed RNA polymerase specialized sigma24 family protein